MLRTLGLFIISSLVPMLIADAQDVSTLEVTADGVSSTMDVVSELPVIVEGVVQLGSEISGSGVLLDLGEASAIAVSSEAAATARDVILISPSGVIAAIARNAAPGSQNPIVFSGPMAAILQLPAGTSAASGFQPGAVISHEVLDQRASNLE
jgi:uncharacterized membrane protein (UPF0127 family)